MSEPTICDECGTAHYSDRCAYCDTQYAMGVADANTFRAERAMFGDDVAEALQIQREMAEEGYW